MKGITAKQVSLLTLATLLAACGGAGGGIDGTPTPTAGGGSGNTGGGSTSAPSPTPAPSPSPTPTPSPTPAPTGSNTSLKGALASETFRNVAASATASYTANGLASASASPNTVNISYDASRDAYVLSSATRSDSFGPANLSAARSSATTTVYLKEDGQTASSLAIVKPSVPAEFSFNGPARVQPEYVAGAVWQRTTKSGSNISGTLDSAAYGVLAPDNAVPRNGSARYEVGLAGVTAQSTDLASLTGTGALTIDFVSGSVTGLGNGSSTSVTTGQSSGAFNWNVTARVASGQNAMSGTISLGGGTGSLNGQFFGPQSQEMGAAFAISGGGGDGAGATSGVLIGKRRDSTALNSSIVGLMFDQRFPSYNLGFVYTGDVSTGELLPMTMVSRARSVPSLRYLADTKTFSIESAGIEQQVFSSSDLVSAESGGSFDVYRKSNNVNNVLSVYKTGFRNGELALTYTGFARYRTLQTQGASNGQASVTITWMPLDIPTPAGALPTTGSGTYLGKMYGSIHITSKDPAIGDIKGDARLDVDFARANFSGFLRPLATTRSVTYDLGSIPITGTIQSGGGAGPGFSMTQTSTNTFFFSGTFNGPGGEEIGGRFSGDIAIPGQNAYSYWTGVVVGKRQ